MNELFMPFMTLACSLFAVCNKDNILPGGPMFWTYEILTPESVEYEGGTIGWIPKECFKANGNEGYIVMTCENFDVLGPISGGSYTYDCGWATLKVEANQLRIHFLRQVAEALDAYEEITILTNDEKKTANTIIYLSKTSRDEGQPDPEPEPLPEEAKFKMRKAYFTPFMHLGTQFPAPPDLVALRITDINDNYTPLGFPESIQYYDSTVWSAEGFPHTFRVYESNTTEGGTETHLATEWSSHFFKSGTIKNYLKGYRKRKVEYETSLAVGLYERDLLGIEWGTIVLQSLQNLTTYCLLDTNYEYQVYDIVVRDYNPFSKIVPVNHKQLSDSDFPAAAQKAIKTLMENDIGEGQNAGGKENLFKCLPEEGVKAELHWENKTTRILVLHQLSADPDDLTQEKYYLHVKPKQ